MWPALGNPENHILGGGNYRNTRRRQRRADGRSIHSMAGR